MLKTCAPLIIQELNSLFNLIYSNGIYPDQWRTHTLSPLYKKGSPSITTNYRGIAVGCSISKLFLSILNNRLTLYAAKHKLIPPHQIGYKKNARTTDHILVLKNLIDKYISLIPRKYLYICFVDFKSAFDSVNRNALFSKLWKCEIGGNFLAIIQNMYQNVYYAVKVDGTISGKISSNVGVKQGCVLSPILFNLFLADLPSIFDENCDPVNIQSNPLSCLMFADDVVLMSESAEGLQKCLDKLSIYCSKWDLVVNPTKTKVVIFNKGGHKIKRNYFEYNGTPVEICSHYTYICSHYTHFRQAKFKKSMSGPT